MYETSYSSPPKGVGLQRCQLQCDQAVLLLPSPALTEVISIENVKDTQNEMILNKNIGVRIKVLRSYKFFSKFLRHFFFLIYLLLADSLHWSGLL